ncbi:hypothetical protein [Ureibacillus sinduriensis]|uniref:Uncharacterized protein n=1 Tax=Ureibacillus sinduriensis BLB-1 = JCM 15800 TaxID=1384057 RepID=A0A0A3HSX2_9BACL|nr:hypothetical protein [Ureibacillus sinduriensis]KGR74280.1 hypothetical protein CD33_20090 [Ureibacillus sinduriensis BLB-1 = JCM 15800]
MQFISHIRQIDYIVSGDFEEATIQELHQCLLPIDPISFKRSEAILAKLKGDTEGASRKLSEVLKEIEKNKELFGFYEAEECLTSILKDALIGLEK